MEQDIKETNSSDSTVENVLNSVNEEYLSKKKKTSKIVYSIVLSIILALSITIIVLSSINVNLKPSFIKEASSYNITLDGTENKINIDESSSEYKEFNNIYLKSFEMKYLKALFSGNLGSYRIVETYDDYFSSSSSTSLHSNLKSQLGQNYVKVNFDEPLTLKDSSGKVYKSVNTSNTILKFQKMAFSISGENAEKDVVFYLGTFSDDLPKARVTKITIKANLSKLYDFVTNVK